MMEDRQLTQLQETGKANFQGEVSLADLVDAVNTLGLDPMAVFITAGPFETLSLHVAKR